MQAVAGGLASAALGETRLHWERMNQQELAQFVFWDVTMKGTADER